MDTANLMVTIFGLIATNAVVLVGFLLQKQSNAKQLEIEREKTVTEVELRAKARETDNIRLLSEEKRWAHGQIAERRLHVLTAAVRCVIRCRLYSALIYNANTAEDSTAAKAAVAQFWENSRAVFEAQRGKILNDLVQFIAPIQELRFWSQNQDDITFITDFVTAYGDLVNLVVTGKESLDEWGPPGQKLYEMCPRMEQWIRTKLDPTALAQALNLDQTESENSPERAPDSAKE